MSCVFFVLSVVLFPAIRIRWLVLMDECRSLAGLGRTLSQRLALLKRFVIVGSLVGKRDKLEYVVHTDICLSCLLMLVEISK